MKKRFPIFLLALVLLAVLISEAIANCQNVEDQDSLKLIEKVYLHTDRDSYFPGDDIWFKAYLIDASTGLLSDFSSNLHVELISPQLNIIESRILKINGGLANGDFRLSEKLKSGKYCIRAYTNYMRNFGEQLFFRKDLTIINSSDAKKIFPERTMEPIKEIMISFFPEGGSLVNNVTSVVAFKAVDSHGLGHNISGEILSSDGEKVTEFRSTHKGMGTFSLTPVEGLKYYAITKNNTGDLVRFEMPLSFSTGVVMNVNGNKIKELNLTFKTNPETFPSVKDNDLTLTISAHNEVFKSYNFRMRSLNSFLIIPATDLPEGIVMLQLKDINKLPLCERLVYLQKYEDVKIKLDIDKKTYNKRDSVCLNISLSDTSSANTEFYLSLSAAENIFTSGSSIFPMTISSWFLLESNVLGPVEEPSYYFDTSNPDRISDLDILLLTQGWRDFKWKYQKMNFLPEHGFSVSGRVRKTIANVPVKNSDVTIAVFKNDKPFINMVPTDSAGRFRLDGIDLHGSARLIASVTNEKDNLKGLLLLDSTSYTPAIVRDRIVQREYGTNTDPLAEDNLPVNWDQFQRANLDTVIQYSEFKSSLQRKYRLTDTVAPGEVNIVARRTYAPESARERSVRYLMGTPDKEIVVTPELQKAYYSTIQLLIGNSVLNPMTRPFTNGRSIHWMAKPLYMIDGMVVSKADVMALPSRLVERIDVLNRAASYQIFHGIVPSDSGKYVSGMDGVISIILKDDYYENNSTVYHTATTRISGYDEPRIFYSPVHNTTLEADYKPDLRSTLLWEPNLKVRNKKDFSLKYYNGDNSSIIRITIEGITSSGIPVTKTTNYRIQ